MQEFPQGADRAAGRFGFAETHGLRPWRRRAPPGLRPGPCPPAAPCRGQALSLRPRPPHASAAPQETAAFPFPEGTPRPPRTLLPRRRPTARRANRPPDGFRGRPAAAPTAAPGAAGPAGRPPLAGSPAPPRQSARRERRVLLSVSIPPSARPPAPPRSFSRCPPASPAAAPSGRAKRPPYPSRRCGSARTPSGSRCKAATHCAE